VYLRPQDVSTPIYQTEQRHILFPNRLAYVIQGHSLGVLDNRAPWAQFRDNNQFRNAWQCCWLVLSGERQISITGFCIEPSRQTCGEIELKLESAAGSRKDRVDIQLGVEEIQISLREHGAICVQVLCRAQMFEKYVNVHEDPGAHFPIVSAMSVFVRDLRLKRGA
jgi:hypothetical protein